MDTSKMTLICTDDFDALVEDRGITDILEQFNDAAECNGWNEATDLENEHLRTYFRDQMYCDYEFFEEEFGDEQVLVVADLGLWNGRREGGDYGKFSTLLGKMIEDYNYIHFDKERGVFVITAIHHDGTNYFTVYKLTAKGMGYLQDHPCCKATHQYIIETKGMTQRFEL